MTFFILYNVCNVLSNCMNSISVSMAVFSLQLFTILIIAEARKISYSYQKTKTKKTNKQKPKKKNKKTKKPKQTKKPRAAKNHLSKMLYLLPHCSTIMNMPVLLSQTHYLLWAGTYMLNFGNIKWLFAQSSYSLPISHERRRKLPKFSRMGNVSQFVTYRKAARAVREKCSRISLLR